MKSGAYFYYFYKNNNAVVKCALSFPNLTISQLVEVKQLPIKQLYSIIFLKKSEEIYKLLLKKGSGATPSTPPLDPSVL